MRRARAKEDSSRPIGGRELAIPRNRKPDARAHATAHTTSFRRTRRGETSANAESAPSHTDTARTRTGLDSFEVPDLEQDIREALKRKRSRRIKRLIAIRTKIGSHGPST